MILQLHMHKIILKSFVIIGKLFKMYSNYILFLTFLIIARKEFLITL